ncbi:hypothetical protein HK099_002733 [Clydaea vesicula]|uniref:CNH domain-containing protein n=1 Tax=Clydaea vesicula TaxID=447962 RepID=A0AAD5U282_9FUNG|nr:hypothetical protein HK099_002733 [Clydaea vesicula]
MLAPPMFNLHPMRVLFMIPKLDSPKLKQSHWSNDFINFLSVCLEKDPEKRPSASDLLFHPFLQPKSHAKTVIQDLIERSKAAKKLRSNKNFSFQKYGNSYDEEQEVEVGTTKINSIKNPTLNLQQSKEEELNISVTDQSLNSGTIKPSTCNNILDSGTIKPTTSDIVLDFGTIKASAPNVFLDSGTMKLPDAKKNLERQATNQQKSIETIDIPEIDSAYNSPTSQLLSNTPLESTTLSEIKLVQVDAPTQDFKTTKLCRMWSKINCADVWENFLIIGTENGLYSYELNSSESKLNQISERKYYQFNIISDLNVIVSRSGKQNVVAIHEIKKNSNFLKTLKFETETKLKKIKETKGCNFYSLFQEKDSYYLTISLSKSILVMKWMVFNTKLFKELLHEEEIISMDIISCCAELRLCIGLENRFRIFSIYSVTAENVIIPEISKEELGRSVKSVLFGDELVLCYQGLGILNSSIAGLSNNVQALTWRKPIKFAEKAGDDLLIVGSNYIDIINRKSGKLVYFLEPKDSKINSIDFILTKENTIFIFAEEKTNDNEILKKRKSLILSTVF